MACPPPEFDPGEYEIETSDTCSQADLEALFPPTEYEIETDNGCPGCLQVSGFDPLEHEVETDDLGPCECCDAPCCGLKPLSDPADRILLATFTSLSGCTQMNGATATIEYNLQDCPTIWEGTGLGGEAAITGPTSPPCQTAEVLRLECICPTCGYNPPDKSFSLFFEQAGGVYNMQLVSFDCDPFTLVFEGTEVAGSGSCCGGFDTMRITLTIAP